jgi:hypothetical protein
MKVPLIQDWFWKTNNNNNKTRMTAVNKETHT